MNDSKKNCMSFLSKVLYATFCYLNSKLLLESKKFFYVLMNSCSLFIL